MTKFSYGTVVAVNDNFDDAVLTAEELDLLQSSKPGYGSRSKIESAFNLVNSTVGAGIIGLPFAIYLAGFWTAILFSIFVAIVSQLGLHMLVVSGQRAKTYKFAALMEYVLGNSGYHFLNFLLLVQGCGACVSYIILIGDTIPVLLELYFPGHSHLTDRSLVILFIAVFLVFPLNLSRSLGSLASWSILSVLCLPVILVTLLWRAPAYSKSHDAPLGWESTDIFGALGILSFAFSCSHVCFSVFLSLKDQTEKSWTITTTLASIMSWIVSISFAVIGYLSFGQDVQPNLFLNFPDDDFVVNIGRFALGFSMILTVPMAFYPTREAVQKLLGFETATRQPNNLQHYAVTIVLFTIITVLGITVRSLGKVYALVGGFAASFLSYILPAVACLVTRRYPEVAGPIIITAATGDDELASVKTPLVSHSETASTSSDEHSIAADDSIPKFGLLDFSAVGLLIWGTVVMIFATSGVFK